MAQVPAAPVVPVADNYEAATNADDLITKALEHSTLSAAQAKAILAAAKAAAAADAAKVAAGEEDCEGGQVCRGRGGERGHNGEQSGSRCSRQGC